MERIIKILEIGTVALLVGYTIWENPQAAENLVFMAGFWKKKKGRQARPQVSDVSAVRVPGQSPEYVVSRSYGETVDLLSEGLIEGIVSGSHTLTTEADKLDLGYKKSVFSHYTATGTLLDVDSAAGEAQRKDLGFLRSVYWNEIPVVDKDGFYNFPYININTVNGNPAGDIASLSPDLPGNVSQTAGEVMDLSIARPIGERLYGPEIKGGDFTPTDTRRATLKSPLDKYAKTYVIYNKECSQIDVNIKVSALMENVQAGPKTYKKRIPKVGFGDTKARTIKYFIYYQPVFDEKFPIKKDDTSVGDFNPNKWSEATPANGEIIQGKLDQPYIRTTSITGLNEAGFSDKVGFVGWRIRIVRTTPESLTSFLRNTSFVDSIVEVFGTKLRYPYSAMVYTQFDARSFQRIPTRAYDTKLLKVKVPNNYNPILKTYGNSASVSSANFMQGIAIGTSTNSTTSDRGITWTRASDTPTIEWDGQFADEKLWTDNPAWAFYDLITNPRYGLGEYIDVGQIDKWVLYEVAQYCDQLVEDTYGGYEPRFTINYVITNREEAFKVLNDLSSIFRGIAYYTNGSIFASQDKYKTAVYQFNNSNVVDGNFSYSSSAKKARHTVAIVRYNDKKNWYQPAIEYVEDEEAVRKYGIREIETSALGCTSRGQARRFAKWILASESQETETVSFVAGQEGSYLRPGDVLQIYDNNRSPLKYSGRTNAVRPLTKFLGNSLAFTAKGSANVNSVVIDQALNFSPSVYYKFSLLTPTYDYEANNITSSEDIEGISRSSIQTLYFNGSDVRSGQSFRSNFNSNGDEACTEIYFNSGLGVNTDGNIAVLDNTYGALQTGNQFNFVDYVITGYSSNIIVPDANGDKTYSNIPYSGGCFSGENLIWSIEPVDSLSVEYIDSSYQHYKAINIKEEPNNSYSVSALLYSTGKYDDVDTVNSAMGTRAIKPVFFPLPDIYGGHTDIDDWVAAYPRQSSYVGATKYNTSTKNLLTLKEGVPFVENDANNLAENLLTLEAEISIAAFQENIVPGAQGKDAQLFKLINESVDGDVGQQRLKDTQKQINYSISVITSGDPRLLRDWDSSAARLNQAPEEKETYVVHKDDYDSGPTVVANESKLLTSEDAKYFTKGHDKIKFESLVDVADKHYVVVYPISDAGVVSHGLMSMIDFSDNDKVFSPVQTFTISSLTTDQEGISSNNDKDTRSTLQTIEEAEPTFDWNLGTVKKIYSEEPDSEKGYELFFERSAINYRLTIREPQLNPETPNDPNGKIYFEFTGYVSPSSTPSFVFGSEFNNPDVINELASRAYTDDTRADDANLGSSRYQIGEGDGATVFFKVPDSGVVIRKSEEYPLREFDIVVETQDENGLTSARNKVYANTINPDTQEQFDSNIGSINSQYDILGVSIDNPSGLFFAQKHNPQDTAPFKIDYVDEQQAFNKKYPYVAQAGAFPNGIVQVQVSPTENPTNGRPLLTSQEYDRFFNNGAGVVFYYTTGDHTFIEENKVRTATNLAPAFTIDLKAQDENKNYLIDSDANIDPNHVKACEVTTIETTVINEDQQSETTTQGIAFGGIVKIDAAYANHAKGEGGANIPGKVFREYFVIGEEGDLANLQIPFPKMTRPEVTNIHFCMAFFDDLSFQRGFIDTDANSGPRYVGPVGGAKDCPKIFTDRYVNFSTRPQTLDIEYTNDNMKEGNFFVEPSTSIFLPEASNLNAIDRALAFRGWGTLSFGQSKREAYKLTKLTSDLVTKSSPSQWGDAMESITEITEDNSRPWVNLLKAGMDYDIETLETATGGKRGSKTYSKGIVNLEDAECYISIGGQIYNNSTEGKLQKPMERKIYIKVPFQAGYELDPDEYQVMVDLNDSRVGVSVEYDHETLNPNQKHAVEKHAEYFALTVVEARSTTSVWHHKSMRTIQNKIQNYGFGPAQQILEMGGIQIKFGILSSSL